MTPIRDIASTVLVPAKSWRSSDNPFIGLVLTANSIVILALGLNLLALVECPTLIGLLFLLIPMLWVFSVWVIAPFVSDRCVWGIISYPTSLAMGMLIMLVYIPVYGIDKLLNPIRRSHEKARARRREDIPKAEIRK